MTDNLTAIYKPVVQKLWDLRRLTALWSFKACYRDNFTSFLPSLRPSVRLHESHFGSCEEFRLLVCNAVQCGRPAMLFFRNVGFCLKYMALQTTSVASRSKAWTVFPSSNACIVSSNPTEYILWHVIGKAELPNARNTHCQATDTNYVSADITNLAIATMGVLLQLSNGL
jgi:hypothetical protein